MEALFLDAVAATQPWMGQLLDEIDVGVIVVDPQGRLHLANRRARHELNGGNTLQLFAGHVRAVQAQDVKALHQALNDAFQGGKRRLVELVGAAAPLSVAVVPISQTPSLTALVLGRRHLGERCMLQWYASSHSLTPCEQRVLEALAQGQSPQHVASTLSVGLATVRTHIGRIRAKTGVGSIRELLHQLAHLPPMASRLPS